MGGGSTITSFVLQPTDAHLRKGCVQLKSPRAKVTLNGVVDLAFRRIDVVTLYGAGRDKKGSRLEYEFLGFEPGDCKPDGYDVINWVVFHFSGDRTIRIEGGQTTSC
jgi:hypothetical protein